MPIPIILGALTLGMGAAQYFGGRAKAKKLAKEKFVTPEELKQNVAAAQQIKTQGMAKETYQGALQNIARNQNFGLAALQDRGKALAGVGNIVQRGNDAALKLDSADATIRNQNMITGTHMEASARQQIGLQKLAFENMKRNQQYQESQNLQGAGIQNMMGGASSLGTWAMDSKAEGLNFWTGKPLKQIPSGIKNANFSNIKWRG